MAQPVTAKADVDKLRTNEKKWTRALMATGWSAFPNIIIEKQQALGLDALDMNIIIHLVQYWWLPENLPHPSVETIAKAIGVTPRTIQKRITALEAHGLLGREERRHTPNGSMTNKYRFDGLIDAARPFALEKAAEMKRAAQERSDRLRRKKPKLVVDNEK
ncbi:helix-turn-helix domain-containing protein [Mesorhizobium sp. M0833]|uniref:helix-turn-helix domain-containing protein n=1 Tax=unclassified Mesorhizobium TaxID=325217 RepID=UPI0015541CF0|nr:helix-turn-helix domain-containing protein [Mesorhizobium sp. NZP2234]QKC92274.1 helix-turn-helix domain-containing protein [Mesorhizobium sp. NZP2234]